MRINHNFGADTHGPTHEAQTLALGTPSLRCTDGVQERSPANKASGSVKSAPFTFAGDKGSGSFAPGQRCPRDEQSCAVGTIDAGEPPTQAEHGLAEARDAGCVAPGDPAHGIENYRMNQDRVPTHCVGATGKTARRLTTAQIEHGQLCLAKWEAVRDYRANNETADWKKVRKETGVSAVEFCRWNKAIKKIMADGEGQWVGTPPRSALVEALAKKSPPGRKPKFALTETEAGSVAAHNLQSNRTATAGSPQEALKHAMKCGEISDNLKVELQQRIADGKPLLTESMRRQVEVGETTVRAYRTPRGAWLNYVQSPGSLQITVDETTGEERMFQPGEMWTIDDATINLILTVPIERPGDKCWDKFGVMVGRFQFIVPADHRSYFIPGFSFTARPRSSYRAEDLTATMHTAFREHGMPKGMFLEMGISKSKLVHETLRHAGVKIQHVHSPHQKVIEALFNKLWTKLSFLPGQVGRNMTDDEETTKLLMSCRAGHTDPRKHFLALDVVVKALHEAIDEHNAQRVMHSRYGKWVPNEFWLAKASAHLRKLDPDSEWMFSPVCAAGRAGDGLRVRGFTVRTTVQLMEGLSQVFHFSAEWLQEFHGAFVKVFFNPFLDAPAKIVLAQDFKGRKAGAILGDAEMTDRHARFNLRKLGYGEFPDIGLAAARQNAQALVRVAKSVRPDGKPGVVEAETRQQNVLPKDNTNTAAEPQAPFLRRRAGIGASDEDFNRTAAKLQRDEARATRATSVQTPVFIEE